MNTINSEVNNTVKFVVGQGQPYEVEVSEYGKTLADVLASAGQRYNESTTYLVAGHPAKGGDVVKPGQTVFVAAKHDNGAFAPEPNYNASVKVALGQPKEVDVTEYGSTLADALRKAGIAYRSDMIVLRDGERLEGGDVVKAGDTIFLASKHDNG